MGKLLQRSALILLAASMILVTGGFSIYHHFCQCEGESTASVFIEADCDHVCSADDRASSCCSVSREKSCCDSETPNQCGSDEQRNDCCNSSSEYLKISDTFTVSLEKVSLKFIAGFIQVLYGTYFIAEPTAHFIISPEASDISPPLYGTKLLYNIHQLKIGHPLV